ncbi:MAG TPA: DnaB-like helicase N-terminal domain-containing protein [Thermoanaerobaculales bacterium]|nr:DnaB-like helicase N-terminal domain-containing protein [Thermoanaerobaculales bacterium]
MAASADTIREAIEAALGAALISVTAAKTVAESLEADDFPQVQHRVVFEAIQRLIGRGVALDVLTVVAELEAADKLKAAGGASRVSDLMDSCPDPERVEAYIEIIKRATAEVSLDAALRRAKAGDEGAVTTAIAALEQLRPRPAAPETPSAPEWPTLQPEALHGLAGEIVSAIAPRTESDPVAILAQLLVAVGSAIGRAPYFMVEADRHGVNEFIVLVGRSARSRKGTSLGHVRRLLRGADEGWSSECHASGLGSGEGLVWAIRDQIVKFEKGAEVVVDSGVADKRLLVTEAEFGAVLKVLQRPGSTLSPVIRDSWDGHDLRTTTKNSPARATAPHISILGHITAEELRALLLETECANGFANRVMWLLVRRARLLPEGGGLMGDEFSGFVRQLQKVLDHGRRCGELKRTPAAREAWAAIYPELSADRPGLLGAMTARAEAHCVRLSLLYALLDSSPVIEVQHLAAALALWQYAEDSARYIFGAALGDPVADRLLDTIRTSPEGATMTVLHDALGRNVPAARITAALQHLEGLDLVFMERLTKTGGRPAIVWRPRR